MTPVNRRENVVGTDNETGGLSAAITAKDAPQQHLQQASEHYACASEHHQNASRYHESGDDKAAAYQKKAEAYHVKVAHEHATLASVQEIDVSKESATLLKEMTANAITRA